METLFNSLVYGAGLGVLAGLFWLGVFALVTWTIKGIKRIYRHFRPVVKTEEQVEAERIAAEYKTRYSNTWIAGYNVGQERVDRLQERYDDLFERYLDQINPSRVTRRAEAAAAKAKAETPIEPEHAQEQIDTDE